MKLRLLILFSLLVTVSKAQKAQNVYFFKNNGQKVEKREDADFVRIIQEPDSGDTRFNLLEFYKNNNRKTIGHLISFEPKLSYDGIIMGFDSLGRRTQALSYKDGVPSGISVYYHSNGSIKRKTEYISSNPPINQMIGENSSLTDFIFRTNSKILYDADSTGKVNIEDGKGHLKEVNKFKEFESVEEGDYVDGMKTGLWTGYDTQVGVTYRETYKANKLISGESIKDGKTYQYTTSMQAPEYKGGQKAWNNFIASNTKFPADALKNGVRGAVKTSFVVDATGKIVDIVIEKSIYNSLDEEAKRVLRYSPRWEPGKQKGIPVRVKYNQSFNFNF